MCPSPLQEDLHVVRLPTMAQDPKTSKDILRSIVRFSVPSLVSLDSPCCSGLSNSHLIPYRVGSIHVHWRVLDIFLVRYFILWSR